MKSRTPRSAKADAKLFRKAAALVESGVEEYSCIAIKLAYGGDRYSYSDVPQIDAYVDLWGQPMLQYSIYEASGEATGRMVNDEWCRNFRVLLLCMAAAAMERP